jgi:hypothetical protein
MYARFALVVSIAAVLVAPASLIARDAAAQQPPGADAMHRGGEHPPHIFAPKGSHRNTTKNLIDHGGPVLPTSNVYAIYWGSGSFGDIGSALENFFTNFSGSTYANILTQYMHETTPASPQITDYVTLAPDISAPPRRAPSVSTIVNEACAGLNGGAPDSQGVYFVITSNFPKGTNYCAWHSYGTCNGQQIAVVYLPNLTGVGGCDISGLSSNLNPFSAAAQSMANVAAHELSEVITDQLLNAWYDSSGQEVGDKCAWQFSGSVSFSDGNSWQLQEEWSNANSGCVQSIP